MKTQREKQQKSSFFIKNYKERLSFIIGLVVHVDLKCYINKPLNRLIVSIQIEKIKKKKQKTGEYKSQGVNKVVRLYLIIIRWSERDM